MPGSGPGRTNVVAEDYTHPRFLNAKPMRYTLPHKLIAGLPSSSAATLAAIRSVICGWPGVMSSQL